MRQPMRARIGIGGRAGKKQAHRQLAVEQAARTLPLKGSSIRLSSWGSDLVAALGVLAQEGRDVQIIAVEHSYRKVGYGHGASDARLSHPG